MIIRKGLRFESRNFAANIEVQEVKKETNEIVLLMMPSDRHDFIVTWPLDEVVNGFVTKIYKEIGTETNFGI